MTEHLDNAAPAFSLTQVYQDLLCTIETIESNLAIYSKNRSDCTTLLEALSVMKRDFYSEEAALFNADSQKAIDFNLDSKLPIQISFYKKVIIQVLTQLKNEYWEKTPYLKALAIQLHAAQAQLALAITHALQATSEVREVNQAPINDSVVYQDVYVSLYCTTGELSDWARLLSNISNLVISRPILLEEKDIKAWIRSKSNKKCEAYIVLRLDKNNIVSQVSTDRPQVNALGAPLVSVKDSRIIPEAIQHFVHEERIYFYQHGALMPKSL